MKLFKYKPKALNSGAMLGCELYPEWNTRSQPQTTPEQAEQAKIRGFLKVKTGKDGKQIESEFISLPEPTPEQQGVKIFYLSGKTLKPDKHGNPAEIRCFMAAKNEEAAKKGFKEYYGFTEFEEIIAKEKEYFWLAHSD